MQAISDFASAQGYTVRALGSTGSVFSGGAEVVRFDPYRVSFFAVDGAALHFRADAADLAWWLGLAPVAAPAVESAAAVKTHYQIVKCGDGEGTVDEVIATVEGSFGVALAMGRELARGKGITLRFVKVTEECVTPVATEGELQTVLPVPALPSDELLDQYQTLETASYTDAAPGSRDWCAAQEYCRLSAGLAIKHPEILAWRAYKSAQRWTAQQAAGYRYQH